MKKMLKSKLFAAFCIASFIIINIIPQTSLLILNGVMIAAYLAAFIIKNKQFKSFLDDKFFSKENINISVISLLISLVFAMRFFTLWVPSSKLQSIFLNSYTLLSCFLFALSVLLLFGTFFAVYQVVALIYNRMIKNDYFNLTQSESLKTGWKVFAAIVITSALFITFLSRSSVLYPFNNWVDANIYFTVGKSVANDLVMYRDIFDQKGPLLYFLHTAAYYISPNTFTGIYYFEIINCIILMFIFYKTMQLFLDSKNILVLIPVSVAVIFSSSAFYMGDSAEEFCLPCLALSNYFALKALIENRKIKYIEWFIVGIASGVVLWTKFSLLGFYIGFGVYIAIVYLKNKWIKSAFVSVAALFAGTILVTIPVFAYFISNNAVKDLIEVYFYDNLFLYTVETKGNKIFSLINNIYYGIHMFFAYYTIGFIVIAAGLLYLSIKNRKLFYFSLCTAGALIFMIYSGGRSYIYYSFILSIYIPFGIIFVYSVLKSIIEKRFKEKKVHNKALKVLVGAIYFTICFAAAFLLSMNTYMLKYEKADLPQYEFDKIISQTEDPTLLNYKTLDNGFYTVSNIVPNCKYFCGTNIDFDELKNVQNYYVENALTDYIVTNGFLLEEIYLDDYECIAEKRFEKTKKEFVTYYLYKKK